jgi:lipoic acid synthetase
MKITRKPEWLKIKIESGEHYPFVKKMVEEHQLHTICSSGKCPNKAQCWSLGTATFMIMGDICTRACKFCATKSGRPLPLESSEPLKIAESIQLMKLKHCVITSVDRDDLKDKGVAHWAETVQKIKELNPNTIIELLIPDYNEAELQPIVDAKPDIIAHNLETVKRLTPTIRSKATYDKSIVTLKAIVKSGLVSKTGIMVGLGETQEEVIELLKEVKSIGCQMITIGQYLQPTVENIEVAEYVTPEVFEKYKEVALLLGFESVESAPLVRSSYMAERSFLKKIEENR